jgi:hypothetical protein
MSVRDQSIDEVPQLDTDAAKRKLGLLGYFVILFSGWVRQDYDFAMIMDTVKRLKQQGSSNVRFVFIGPPEAMIRLDTA